MNFGKIILVVVTATLVIGGFYILTLFSPSPVEDDSFMYVGSDKENEALLLESEKLEKQFEQMATQKGLTEETVSILRKSIRLQEVYIDRAITRDRAPAERLMKLRKRLQNIEAKPISEIVDTLEQKAKNAEEKNDIVTAEKYLTEAYTMQNKINIDYALSNYRNIHRALKFDNDAKTLRARPIYLKSIEAEKKAKEAIETKDWNKAREEFEKAINYLSKINSEFPNSSYTDFSRLQSLDIELESLKSTTLFIKLEDAIKKAEKAKQQHNFPMAAEAYGDAVELQRTINKTYPHSRHASDENLAKLEKDKNNAYSWDYANAIKDLEKKLSVTIKNKDINNIAEISSNLLSKVEQFKTDYPHSNQLPQDMILKLRYISFMIGDILTIQNMVLSNLISINGKKMLKTEVSQKLYKLVMKENPSRYIDDDNPIDSVSYDDVERFCSRLSWLLASKVSVPSEEDFTAAIGSLRYANINDISWNNSNSNSRTHKIATKKMNDKGFYDLIGNVEEFVTSKDLNDSIMVMGGSSQTTTDAILDLAKKTVDYKTRNRILGFRIVVED